MSDVVYDPKRFDLFLNTEGNLSDDAIAQLPDTPMGRLRRVQVRFARGRPHEFAQLEEEANSVAGPIARGVRLSLLVALHRHELVLATNPEPLGCMATDLEDACLAHAAHGMSAAQLGQYHRALEHLRTATTLARAVGLQHRSQQLEVEWHRMRVLLGQGAPEEVELLLTQEMPPRRMQFGQRVHALCLMSYGRYDAALTAMGTPDADCPHDAGLREWLHALCRLPPARLMTDPIFVEGDQWVILADAYRQLTARREGSKRARAQLRLRLDVVTYEPQASYARLLSAVWIMRDGEMPATAVKVLGEAPPERPDQAVMWALARMQALVSAPQPGTGLLDAVEILERTLPRLHGASELLDTLRPLAPEWCTTLTMGPLSRLVDCAALSSQPMLLGKVVACGGERIELPGRTGGNVVLKGAGAIHIDTWRSEQKRMKDVLVGFGGNTVANMGIVLHILGMVADLAARLNYPLQAQDWANAARQIEQMMSEDVQCVLSVQRPHYLLWSA